MSLPEECVSGDLSMHAVQASITDARESKDNGQLRGGIRQRKRKFKIGFMFLQEAGVLGEGVE